MFGSVVRSKEFRRIENIPRRVAEPQDLNANLQKPGALRRLFPLQSQALWEFHITGGLFAPLPVGSGKGPLSVLLPTVVECHSPLLIIPAKTMRQTMEEVIPEARRDFHVHENLAVMSYEALQTPRRRHYLMDGEFDCLIFDEMQYLKSLASARTKRAREVFRLRPNTKFAFLTGTIARKSIKDFAHLLHWALRDNCPVPTNYSDLDDWACAIDVGVPADKQKRPGALKHLCKPGESTRQGVYRRIIETQGVIAGTESSVDVPLTIHLKRDLTTPDSIQAAIDHLRSDWETPGGEEVSDPLDYARKFSEITHGFYYVWDPAPPPEWLIARKEWRRWVRETIKYNRRGFDSESLLTQAVDRGEYGMVRERDAWKALRDTFKINTVPVWISPYMLHHAAEWAQKHDGVIWNNHRAVEDIWTDVTGLPYFGGGDGRIEFYDKACGASLRAHSDGKNLQKTYSKAFYLQPPSAGLVLEQSIGRMHRHGQKHPVDLWVAAHVDEYRNKWNQVLEEDVPFLREISGPQKVDVASIIFEG